MITATPPGATATGERLNRGNAMTTPASDALAEESHPAFSPRSILRTLWKRRYWIAAVWLIITAFAASIVRRLPAVYVAEAVILVDSQAILEKFVSATVASVP